MLFLILYWLRALRIALRTGVTANGQVKLDDVPALLKQYEESEIAGSILTEETRRSRLNRLVNIMSSEEDVDDTLRTITDFVCDLLVKYQDSPNVDEWLQALVEKNPRLLDQLQRSQVITKHIAELEDKLENLAVQKGLLEQEIEESRQRAETIDQQAIEAKKREMLEKEAGICGSFGSYWSKSKALWSNWWHWRSPKKYKELKGEVDYLSIHKNHLTSDTSGLELQFQQLISRPHEKMVEIAFDGFMASKMLRAAAEWEAEQSNGQHIELRNQGHVPSIAK